MIPFMEPFRIKAVEDIPFTTLERREEALRAAGYNPFNLASADITIDLLTDSGTGAMSDRQWAALMVGDEAYAGARSFTAFERVVRELSGFEHVLPTHQGRAAERILFTKLLEPGQITVSNTHFDTTSANIDLVGGEARDFPSPDTGPDVPFAGNIDLDAVRELLAGPEASRVRAVIMTIPNNAGGGQPVSLAHLHEVRRLCDEHGLLLMLDASRFAENAYLVTRRECSDRTPRDVAEETFRLADLWWASLKKDGISNIGGVLATSDEELARSCRELLVATEGFSTYGGLAGRDLEVLARGLSEVTDPTYLRYREQTAAWFADRLEQAGIPVTRPTGLHAVYADAGQLLDHIPPHDFPGVALVAELYREAGIRTVELGSLAFARRDADDGSETPAPQELVRFCLPRRVYTAAHLDYVAQAAAQVAERRKDLSGYRIVTGKDSPTRHFFATLAPLD